MINSKTRIKDVATFDASMMKKAFQIARLSKCIKRQVGAIVYKDTKIIGTGFNHTVGEIHNCYIFDDLFGKRFNHSEYHDQYEIHAEATAILEAAKTNNIKGAAIYVTLKPCWSCTKLIIESGIDFIIFKKIKKGESKKEFEDWKDFLKINKVIYKQL